MSVLDGQEKLIKDAQNKVEFELSQKNTILW